MLAPAELDAVIDAILRGEEDAFRKILRAYGLPLRSYIAAWVHHVDDVDDIAQEVFFVAYRSLRDFRRGDDLGAWLRGIARNKVYHHFRNSSRRNKALERFREEAARVVESKLERAVSGDHSGAIEMLLKCVALLPERMRRVVRAGLDGGKPADLAGELVTTVGAVYRLHYRANRLLRDCMQKGTG
jgi:RNA polymerase sigma-70 factor (ECF subfamily)